MPFRYTEGMIFAQFNKEFAPRLKKNAPLQTKTTAAIARALAKKHCRQTGIPLASRATLPLDDTLYDGEA
jgi:hypothetical protein